MLRWLLTVAALFVLAAIFMFPVLVSRAVVKGTKDKRGLATILSAITTILSIPVAFVAFPILLFVASIGWCLRILSIAPVYPFQDPRQRPEGLELFMSLVLWLLVVGILFFGWRFDGPPCSPFEEC